MWPNKVCLPFCNWRALLLLLPFHACHKCYKNSLWFWNITSTSLFFPTRTELATLWVSQYNKYSLKLISLPFCFPYFLTRQIAAGLVITEFNAAAFEVASRFDTTNFTSDTTRQLSKVGKKSLSDEEMKNLSAIISQMGQIYGEVRMQPRVLKLATRIR